MRSRRFLISAVILAVVLIVGAIAASKDDSSSKFKGEQKKVAQAIERIESDTSNKDDAQKTCDEALTANFAGRIIVSEGKTCADYLSSTGFKLTVQSVAISGDRATARVKDKDSEETFTLVKQGGRWKLDDIAAA
jgi:outer membrane murein-binding lipoprotein Lpp